MQRGHSKQGLCSCFVVFSLQRVQKQICSMKNYSQAWVTGSGNHLPSNLLDHARNDQHLAAMSHPHTAQAKARQEPIVSYTPIAHSLLMLEESEWERMRCKFDVCYVMAKESVTFKKYEALYVLEVCHGVDPGFAYETAPSAKLFTHYIVESHCQHLLQDLTKSKFCSFLMAGARMQLMLSSS